MPKYGPAFGMATNSSSSTSDIIISSSSSSHQMETSHLPITAHKLNGQNYLQWSQSILMFIRGKEKDDYITGASAAPETTASTYKKWIAENNMVMSWLVNSMTADIGENFLSFDTAKKSGTLQKKLSQTRKTHLKSSRLKASSTICVKGTLRGRIMGVKPLPSLREAFSEVRREESRKNLMMGSHQQLNMAESSALKTQFAPFDNRQKIKGGRPWCDHCRKPGHSRETCWKIHGKPVDWKPRQPLEKEGRGNHVATDEQSPQPEASPFNKEQMEMLQKLLSPLLSVQSQTGSSSNQVIGSGTLAHKGNFLSAFTAGKKRKKPWIVDSGASDHMTGDATIFDTYNSCPNNLTVRIADGSLSKVAGTGSVVLSRDLTLNSVLLVPNLDCNLLSISKLTKEKRCITNFSSTHCEFQDLDSGKTIGNAEECSGLYILKERHDPQEQPQMTVGENSTQEYQFWDLESFSESPITTENHIPPESFNQPESIVDLWDKEHIQEETEERALSQQTHEAEPGPNPSKLPGNNAPDGTVDSELENDILNMPIAWRKGVRSCTQHPIGNFISYDKLSPTFRAFTSSITEIQVPQNIQEAFKYPKWKAAVDEEVRALEKNGTWEITDLPRGKKPVGCKWIFTVKYKADGNVDRYKARLVAKGFTQSYGIDYQETFAPVAKLNTVRVLLSLAANLDWSLHQLDVKNAFLNGDLEEEVYMDIPVGLETTSNFNKVCRLRKSLYGLKQSPRAWFERFTKVVKGYGFVQCQSNHTLFVKHFPEGKLAIIIVYVDDIILTGDHEEKIDLLKKLLTKEFEIKDLGNLKYFLGMEIARSKKGIAVSQRKYVLDLLNETGMLGCKPAETPMDTTVKLEESDGSAPVDKGRYQRLVGKLIYLSHTRPDIGFFVSVVSQFMNNPTEKHMTAVIRILRYLKMTPGKGLLFIVWGNLVTWRSKKQSVVARSSAEAEFRAMAQGICEGIWLNRLLEELRVPLKHPMVLYCDNQAAISIAKNPVHHDRTKHVEIDRHFIKEKIEEGVFKVSYTPTNCQTADILTKALARVNFEDLTEKLGMINIYNVA
ncbi:Retrovirus-related Pol polyprotein from transposon RE1 [Vitis vinifera]|uniref:Retrovirus-related Pol polyprotein from transposon RE1 n=1 Tax=Vitis vinifera TaxID=29760 RepID=A0A438EXN9_VITVI|nr:Retrovirus-related Pol polyprotein from transposon RE1 [Vitis vinifera]